MACGETLSVRGSRVVVLAPSTLTPPCLAKLNTENRAMPTGWGGSVMAGGRILEDTSVVNYHRGPHNKQGSKLPVLLTGDKAVFSPNPSQLAVPDHLKDPLSKSKVLYQKQNNAHGEKNLSA